MVNNNPGLRLLSKIAIIILLLQCTSLAQQNNVASVNVQGGTEGQELRFEIAFFQISGISKVILAYKNYGAGEFEVTEMIMNGTTASVKLTSDKVMPPAIDYYFIIENVSGMRETYPAGCPLNSNPLVAQVTTSASEDDGIIVLNPEENQYIKSSDFFLSVSLLRAPSNIDASATKVYIDSQDLTELSVRNEDLIYFQNEAYKLSGGYHTATIEMYDSSGGLLKRIIRHFTISETAQLAENSPFRNTLNLTGESRHEKTGGNSEWYNNLRFNSESEYKSWILHTDISVTSEEKRYLQPNNRYSVSLENDWIRLDAGDSYPDFPSLILSGKRVRGISGTLNTGFFALQAAYGEISRPVEGKLLELLSSGYASVNSNIVEIDSAKYGKPLGLVEFGTYKRTLFAVRPSFHSGDAFRFGLTYLHSADKKESIGFGTHPKENIVFGSDLRIALDEQRIQFETQAAFSMQNYDISEGTLSDAQIDSIFSEGNNYDISASDVKEIKKSLGSFITVNEHITPLNPEKLPTLAAESALSFNYLNNYFKAGYIFRGNDFQSFGQSFIRTDVSGFSFADRLRLIDNKLFISLGYEHLYDNLQNTKPVRTKYKTFNASVSLFPRTGLPNITLAYTLYDNSNGLEEKDSLAVLNKTGRFTLQTSYDFFLRVQHHTSLTVSTSSKNDNSYRDIDVSNTSVMFSVISRWRNDISSSMSLSVNNSRISTYGFNYTSLSGGVNYDLIPDKLLLSSVLNFSFGNLKRQSVDISAEYTLPVRLKFALMLRYLNYTGSGSDRIVSLLTQYEI
ncbi:MAG: hypothetical protein ACM3SM_04515 [Bacteroidota bacterium]